jgi:hypothetical protein
MPRKLRSQVDLVRFSRLTSWARLSGRAVAILPFSAVNGSAVLSPRLRSAAAPSWDPTCHP